MKTANRMIEVYEIPSPSFNDLNLDQQISFGINDWVAVDTNGREFFGRSKMEAIEALVTYHAH